MLHNRLHKIFLIGGEFRNTLQSEDGQVLDSDPGSDCEKDRRVLSYFIWCEFPDASSLLKHAPWYGCIGGCVTEADPIVWDHRVEVDPLANLERVLQMVDFRPPV